jgi:asparagine synthase (glutamine-hydrolysing)
VYNYKELYQQLKTPYSPATGSDCEVILPLFEQHEDPSVFLNKLRGMFAFVIYNKATGQVFAARDHLGTSWLRV